MAKLPESEPMASPTLGKNLSSKFEQKISGSALDSRIPRHSGILPDDLVDQLHDAVIAVDLQGNIVGCNRAAIRTYGYSPNELIGRNLTLLNSKEEQISWAGMLSVILEKGQHCCELRTRAKSGTDIYVHLSFSLLRDSESVPVGAAAIFADITEQRSLQLALNVSHGRRKLAGPGSQHQG